MPSWTQIAPICGTFMELSTYQIEQNGSQNGSQIGTLL
jgi:hypothetical protein